MEIMRRSRLLVMLSVPLLALLVLFGVVRAGDAIVTDSVSPRPTNWSETLTFPKFNPISGTLTSVEIVIGGSVSGSVAYESLDAAPSTVLLELKADISVQRPDKSSILLVVPDATVTATATAFDGVIDFGGTSGGERPDLEASTVETITLTDPADLSLFSGVGDISLTAVATGTSQASGPGNVLLVVSGQAAGVAATVKYTFVSAAINLEKTVYAGHNNGVSCPGGELVSDVLNSDVTYCFVVTNPGETYLDQIIITDADLGIPPGALTLLSAQSSSLPLAPLSVDPNARLVYYFDSTIGKNLVNTAHVEGTPTDPTGTPIPGVPKPTDRDTAEVTLPASLGDLVWLDANANGLQDSNEVGLNGVSVLLLDENGVPTGKSTVTANKPGTSQPGWYSFTGLPPGDYQLQFVNPDNNEYVFTVQNASQDGANDRDSDVDSTGRTQVITLTAGQDDPSWDAGLYRLVPTALDEVAEPNSRSQATQPLFLPLVVR